MTKEYVTPLRVRSEHIVQLFDAAETRAQAVSAFVKTGLDQGAALLVVATPDHWEAAAAVLEEAGVDLAAETAARRLVVLDAAATLARCVRSGRPDQACFDESVGTIVRELSAAGSGLRIYGEMVELLASEGDFDGARQLEDLWNGLGARQASTLFCGYSAVHFGNPGSLEALRGICASHARVTADPRDLLSAFLIGEVIRA